MTNKNSLDFGDMVRVSVLPENREWGYDPCHDGTIAKVVGFAEIELTGAWTDKPGVYRNRYWPILEADGKNLGAIYKGHLVPLDENKAKWFVPLRDDDFLRELSFLEMS